MQQAEGEEVMRFAVIATTVATVVGVPLAVSAAGRQMSSAEFMSAVECVAYENAAAQNPDLGVAKLRLNAEAAKQPATVVAAAERQARAISAAVEAGAPPPGGACGASQIADEGGAHRAV
jgi:hypothetical protein